MKMRLGVSWGTWSSPDAPLDACGPGSIFRGGYLYMAGKLRLGKLVSTGYSLDQINDAIRDTLEGKTVRGIIKF